jgi:hypothetical protein
LGERARGARRGNGHRSRDAHAITVRDALSEALFGLTYGAEVYELLNASLSTDDRTKRCSSLALTSCGVDNPIVASC